MPHVALAQTELHYRVAGRGTTLLVLVHGWYQNGSQAWSALKPLLSNQFQTVIPDLPGHGLSPLTSPSRLHQNDDLLIDFLNYVKRRYKPKKIILIGHSYGAFLVQQVLAKNPSVVHGAVAMAAIDDYAPYVGRLRRALWFPKFLAPLYYRVQGLLGAFPYGDRRLLYAGSTLSPGRLEFARLKNRTLSPQASRAYMVAFLGAKVNWPAKKISTRLLLIYGATDSLTPASWAKKILPQTASGSVVIIPDAGHNVQISGAVKVASAIGQFVAGCG